LQKKADEVKKKASDVSDRLESRIEEIKQRLLDPSALGEKIDSISSKLDEMSGNKSSVEEAPKVAPKVAKSPAAKKVDVKISDAKKPVAKTAVVKKAPVKAVKTKPVDAAPGADKLI